MKEQLMSKDLTEIPLSDLVRTYRKVRDAVQEKEEAFKADIQSLRDQLETVGNAILATCNAQNMDSIRTPEGTVSRRVSSRYWTTDWESMYKFIKENDIPFLLEQRIHNGNMKQFLEENPDSLPIGLQCDRKYVLHVRKPTGKKED
jgi:hypothetical protein